MGSYLRDATLATTYSSSRTPSINWNEDTPSSLYNPKYSPTPWGSQVALDIRVDPYIAVTGLYWSAFEQWDYSQWPGIYVYKHGYLRSNDQTYPVPDHYQPITNRSLSLGAPSSPFYFGSELVMNPYRRSIYVPVLKNVKFPRNGGQGRKSFGGVGFS